MILASAVRLKEFHFAVSYDMGLWVPLACHYSPKPVPLCRVQTCGRDFLKPMANISRYNLVRTWPRGSRVLSHILQKLTFPPPTRDIVTNLEDSGSVGQKVVAKTEPSGKEALKLRPRDSPTHQEISRLAGCWDCLLNSLDSHSSLGLRLWWEPSQLRSEALRCPGDPA